MRLQIDAAADFSLPEPTPALLQIEVATLPDGTQTVETSGLSIAPPTDTELFTDFYANGCRRLMLPQGTTRVTYHAIITQPEAPAPEREAEALPDALHLPPLTLLYLLPSRYCPSDRLGNMAQDLFGHHGDTLTRTHAVCAWINQHIHYEYGTSDAATSALDTVLQRQGVCRDFAHLGISFCRALNIPARYVSGYCLGLKPPDFHAYFQAYINDRWMAFDATAAEPRPALVQIAIGRDAADCAWSTFYGLGQIPYLSVSVQAIS